MGLLTVFANFRIDSEERFLRMQDSYRSFKDADIDKWVINVRGPLKAEAATFLRENLGDRLTLYEMDSPAGWFHDSRRMLKSIGTEYVFFWIEDQICLAGVDYFNQVVAEMKRANAEYLLYTAFHEGDSVRSFATLPSTLTDSLMVLDYDAARHRQRMALIRELRLTCATFVISAPSILARSLFARILTANDPVVKRSPRETPFDFEKNSRDTHWLPIRVAQTRREFFAFVDDDHGRAKHSLISRGLYPNRIQRSALLNMRESHLKRKPASLLRSRVAELINLSYSRVIRPLVGRV